MWKKSWNKLKTALETPEEYIEVEEKEESAPPEEEKEEPSEPEFCSAPAIPINRDDLMPLYETMESIKRLKGLGGELLIRHEKERVDFLKVNNALNEQMQRQITDLRTTYNVEPTVDYALNFPVGEEEQGSFVRADEPSSES